MLGVKFFQLQNLNVKSQTPILLDTAWHSSFLMTNKGACNTDHASQFTTCIKRKNVLIPQVMKNDRPKEQLGNQY